MKKPAFHIILGLLLITSLEFAGQIKLPQSSGFRGFVRPSIGYLNFSNNMVASFLRYDLANPQINSIYTIPPSQGTFLFLIPFEVNYTFAKSKTQLFLGIQLDDLIRFNLTQQFGVRQQFEKIGIFQAAFLFNGLPTMVWEDPYMADSKRLRTDRHSFGVGFQWDLIFNSNFRFNYSLRRIRIGNEKSGEYLQLIAAERELLNRNGYMHNFEILYWIKLKNHQLLAPAISYLIDARVGSARARNAIEAKLNYTWLGKQFSATANTFVGYSKFKGSNPIYNKTEEDIYFSAIMTVYYKNPWGWKIGNSEPMNFFLNVAIYRSNTNIDFYYRDAFMVSTGVFFRWAKKN